MNEDFFDHEEDYFLGDIVQPLDPDIVYDLNQFDDPHISDNIGNIGIPDYLGEPFEVVPNKEEDPNGFFVPPPPINGGERFSGFNVNTVVKQEYPLITHIKQERRSRSLSPATSSTSETSIASEEEIMPASRNNSKPRRRRKRKAIEIEEDTKRLSYLKSKKNKNSSEKAELRKLRNRDSAAKSRARRAKLMEKHEDTISRQRLSISSLQEENRSLKSEIESLRKENIHLTKGRIFTAKNEETQKLRSRIAELEQIIRNLRIGPRKVFSAAVVLIVVFLIAMVVSSGLGRSNCNTLVFHPDDYYCEDDGTCYYLHDKSYAPNSAESLGYRDPLGMYDWEMEMNRQFRSPDGPPRALPSSTEKTAGSSDFSVMKIAEFEGETNDYCVFEPDDMAGMIPVEEKVKNTFRDPFSFPEKMKFEEGKEVRFSEEMFYHFISSPQYYYTNENSKMFEKTVPPAMTTSVFSHANKSNICGGKNDSMNLNTIFIDEEDEEISFEAPEEDSEPTRTQKMYSYMYKNKKDGEIAGWYYGSEDLRGKKVFMSPHIFPINGDKEFHMSGRQNETDDGDSEELIVMFPIEVIKGPMGEELFKLAEIHIPYEDVHFGESYMTFQQILSKRGEIVEMLKRRGRMS